MTKQQQKANSPPKVIRRGKTVIIKEKGKGLTVHASEQLHSDGLKRMQQSKRFPSSKGVTQYVSGKMLVLRPIHFSEIRENAICWLWVKEYNAYTHCVKISSHHVKSLANSRVFQLEQGSLVLFSTEINYSYTINKNPETVNQMATAKKASKKGATKKAANKSGKSSKNGLGIVAQIQALAAKGLTNAEITAKGFNAGTVGRQASLWRREHGGGRKAAAKKAKPAAKKATKKAKVAKKAAATA